MLQPYFLLLWTLLFLCTTILSLDDRDTTTVIINTQTDDYQNIITQSFSSPFSVSNITLNSDIAIQQEEILYLLGFNTGSIINADTLKKALFYLIKKNIFEKITISATSSIDGSKALHFTLQAFWTLASLKIHGIWFGKDTYRHIYTIDIGEPFDIRKHHDSLQVIKESLKAEGFLDALLHDTITYNHEKKTIDVVIGIDKKASFTISNVVCFSYNQQSIPQNIYLQEVIEPLLNKRMATKKYTKHFVAKEILYLKDTLTRDGYTYAQPELTERLDSDNKTVQLIINITLYDKKEFFFFGNHFFSSKQLRQVLRSFGNVERCIPPLVIAQEIENMYQQKGFLQVHVEPKQEAERTFFIIQEGPQAIIQEISLKNNNHFETEMLIKKYLHPITTRPFYDTSVIEKSIDDLESFYHKEGFFDAQVIAQNAIHIDGNAYQLILTIDEGQQHLLQSVVIDQYQDFLTNYPYSQALKEGKVIICSQTCIDTIVRWATNELKKHGYAYSNVYTELLHNGLSVDLLVHIDISHTQEQCGKTVLIGTHDTPFSVISRELLYREGDHLDKKSIKKSLSRIKELDIFDSVSLYPDQSDALGLQRAILLKTYPTNQFELRMRGGFGLQQMRWPFTWDGLTYRCGGEFIVKNPTKCGDRINLDFNFTRIRRDMKAAYKRPWVFGLPINAIMQGYANKFEQQGFFCDRQNWYHLYQDGFLIGLSNRTGPTHSTTNIGFEWTNICIRDECRSLANVIAHSFRINDSLINTYIPYFFVEPTIMIDFVDQKINPTKGFFTLFSCKVMTAMGHIAQPSALCILRLLLEQEIFMPLHWAIIALRLRAGIIAGAPLSDIMLNERFYLGGTRSLRSYYTDCTPPLGMFHDAKGCQHFVPQGGKIMINSSIEARIPVGNGLHGIVFQDFGILSDTYQHVIDLYGVLSGTGFGIMYETPIGPLRFDIAWKWECKEPFDRSYCWFLSLGNTF